MSTAVRKPTAGLPSPLVNPASVLHDRKNSPAGVVDYNQLQAQLAATQKQLEQAQREMEHGVHDADADANQVNASRSVAVSLNLETQRGGSPRHVEHASDPPYSNIKELDPLSPVLLSPLDSSYFLDYCDGSENAEALSLDKTRTPVAAPAASDLPSIASSSAHVVVVVSPPTTRASPASSDSKDNAAPSASSVTVTSSDPPSQLPPSVPGDPIRPTTPQSVSISVSTSGAKGVSVQKPPFTPSASTAFSPSAASPSSAAASPIPLSLQVNSSPSASPISPPDPTRSSDAAWLAGPQLATGVPPLSQSPESIPSRSRSQLSPRSHSHSQSQSQSHAEKEKEKDAIRDHDVSISTGVVPSNNAPPAFPSLLGRPDDLVMSNSRSVSMLDTQESVAAHMSLRLLSPSGLFGIGNATSKLFSLRRMYSVRVSAVSENFFFFVFFFFTFELVYILHFGV